MVPTWSGVVVQVKLQLLHALQRHGHQQHTAARPDSQHSLAGAVPRQEHVASRGCRPGTGWKGSGRWSDGRMAIVHHLPLSATSMARTARRPPVQFGSSEQLPAPARSSNFPPLTAAVLHKCGVQLLRLVNGLPILIQPQVPHVQLPILTARRQQRVALASCLASTTAASKLQRGYMREHCWCWRARKR